MPSDKYYMKIDYKNLLSLQDDSALSKWFNSLPEVLAEEFSSKKHGRMTEWDGILDSLPMFLTSHIRLNSAAVEIGKDDEITLQVKQALDNTLRRLHPWRKGPFKIFGIPIDTEWHSDWKWQRLEHAIQPLTGRQVLDVGCGSGYHCWRMLGAGACRVIGIEPIMLYVVQFYALKHFTQQLPVEVLPFSLEDLPEQLNAFDTVFSMGVMYHRKSPIDHLLKLHSCLRRGGELVLETLIIEGEDGKLLMPEGRYAKMRNVWFIPDVPTLMVWLKRTGFTNLRLVNINRTSLEEQRTTDWMEFESLQDFLDPEDHQYTIEGYPAPVRAILTATAS